MKSELAPLAFPAERSAAVVYVATLGSPRSRETMAAALRRVSRLLGADDPRRVPWHLMRWEHSQALRSALIAEGLAPATVNRHLCALRGTLRAAWRLGDMTHEDYARASDVAGVKGSRLPPGRALSMAELRALFEATAGERPADVRDVALFAVLAGAGLRRAELCALDLQSWTLVIGVMGRLRVLGKGNRERSVPLPSEASSALARWMELRGPKPGAMFHPIRRGGAIQRRRMTERAIRLVCLRRAEAAALEPFGPHDLRRTYVSRMLDASGDHLTTSRLAGHRSPATTARYDRRGEAAEWAAVQSLRIPVFVTDKRRLSVTKPPPGTEPGDAEKHPPAT